MVPKLNNLRPALYSAKLLNDIANTGMVQIFQPDDDSYKNSLKFDVGGLVMPDSAFGFLTKGASAIDFTEALQDARPAARDFLVLAPHGGEIEPFTDRQAIALGYSLLREDGKLPELTGKPAPDDQELAKALASTWICRGYGDGDGDAVQSAYARWHVTSADISFLSFPKLRRLEARQHQYEYVVSFHGMVLDEPLAIAVGGQSPGTDDLRDEVVAELRKTIDNPNVRIFRAEKPVKAGIPLLNAADTDEVEHLGGNHPRNIINRFARHESGTAIGAIQIEQTLPVRATYWRQVVRAVRKVLRKRWALNQGILV
jgi:phage replication-related protein YjqB (UPF0714/DUF867 family)